MKTHEVVAAIIIHQDKILCMQRDKESMIMYLINMSFQVARLSQVRQEQRRCKGN